MVAAAAAKRARWLLPLTGLVKGIAPWVVRSQV